MKLSVFCLFCVIIPSWTQEDYCWPHNIQVCRHFLVSSLVTASVLFGYFGFGYCMFNFVGVWNCRNWKSQPSSKFKICNFPCHPYHLHFTLGWENSKPPLQNKCRLRRDCVRVPGRILRSGDAGDPSQYSARSAYRLSQPNGLLWVSSGGYCWVDQSDIDKSSIITRIRKVLLKNYLPSV